MPSDLARRPETGRGWGEWAWPWWNLGRSWTTDPFIDESRRKIAPRSVMQIPPGPARVVTIPAGPQVASASGTTIVVGGAPMGLPMRQFMDYRRHVLQLGEAVERIESRVRQMVGGDVAIRSEPRMPAGGDPYLKVEIGVQVEGVDELLDLEEALLVWAAENLDHEQVSSLAIELRRIRP